MFNLDLFPGEKILSIADGPSSFNKEARAKGAIVDSVDPVYGMPIEEIKAYFKKSYDYNKGCFLENRQAFVMKNEQEIEALLAKRSRTFELFLEDFTANPTNYKAGRLPALSGLTPGYDLCLCSNFLFLFSHLFDLDFHIAAISELLRLAGEVRIFPLYDIEGKQSPYVAAVIELFSKTCTVTIEQVPYEVYKNGNRMLRIIQVKNW